MEISELIKKKNQLHKDIDNLLFTFYEETGISIKDFACRAEYARPALNKHVLVSYKTNSELDI
jgi:hypothetical protein